jgi:hypothetical protein
MFLLIICIVLIIIICIYCLNNKIVEGYDQTQNCIGTYDEYYEPCSKTCGGGSQKLAFNVDIDPVSGYFRGNQKEPVPCPLDLTRECNTHNCPIDCKYVGGGEGWGDWIKNLDRNGKQIGTETRTRQIRINHKYGGKSCDNLTETRKHNVNCVQSKWSDWGACSKTCGGGTKTKTRSILQEKKNGGQSCGPSSNTRSCNTHNCPINCVQSDWSNWGACSKPCGGGTQTKTRSTSQVNKYGGIKCGPSSNTRSCNAHKCPINCVGKWEWTGNCSGSQRRQKYRITRNSAYGGRACPAYNGQLSGWHQNACNEHCRYRKWYCGGCCSHEWRPK